MGKGAPGRSAKGSDWLPLQRAAGDIALALQALRIGSFLLDGAPAFRACVKEGEPGPGKRSARDMAGSGLRTGLEALQGA